MTASPMPDAPRASGYSSRYAKWLLGIFVVYWAAWAIKPIDVKDWMLENVLTVIFVGLLLWSYRRFPLSNISYTLIFLYLCLHTIGTHYTYSLVPYDNWFRAIFSTSLGHQFGWERNHFDRLVHFCFGFLLAYPIRELFLRIAGARGFWGYYLPLDLTMSFSMLYELVEWAAAVGLGGELGQAYLGTQGDIWDAHKDMALASIGALISVTVVALINWKYDRDFTQEFLASLSVKTMKPLGEYRLREMMKE